MFAESPATHNRGKILFAEDQGRRFAVGIVIDRGIAGSVDIRSVVWVAATIVCLVSSHVSLKVFRSCSSVVNWVCSVVGNLYEANTGLS